MALITKPFTFTAGNAAVASEVNQDFDTIYSEVNGNLNTANISTNQHVMTWTFYTPDVDNPGGPVPVFELLFSSPADAAIVPVQVCIGYTGPPGVPIASNIVAQIYDITGGVPGSNISGAGVTCSTQYGQSCSAAVFTVASIAAGSVLMFKVTPNAAAFAGRHITMSFTAKKLLTT